MKSISDSDRIKQIEIGIAAADSGKLSSFKSVKAKWIERQLRQRNYASER